MLMRPASSVLSWDAMDYRLYWLDRFTEHIVSAKDLVAPDDAHALAQAQEYCDTHSVELWQGTRCVGRFEQRKTASHAGPP